MSDHTEANARKQILADFNMTLEISKHADRVDGLPRDTHEGQAVESKIFSRLYDETTEAVTSHTGVDRLEGATMGLDCGI